jgi:glycosyltransferase involved in cell wall biosynthesis
MQTRPLHVLWLIDHVCWDGSLHGGGRLYRNLLPAFDPARVRVFPYFLRASDDVRRVFADAPVRVETLGKAKYDPTTLFTLLRLCRRHEIDAMHLYCYASSSFGRIAAALLGVPAVIHDFDTQIYFPYPLYLKILDRVLAPGTARAIAASPLCRDYMRDVRRVPEERIDLMPHAIPDALFVHEGRPSRAEARARLGWDPRWTVFCAVTKLGPDRGNELLLEAFARVAQEAPSAHLAIVYKPTLYHRVPEEYESIPWIRDPARMRADLEERVRALGLERRVHLAESLDDATPSVLASDVVVAPFQHERFSSVNLLEAAALGRAVIATDLGESRVFLRAGETGLLVPPGDVEALAAAMLCLARDPAERERFGAAAEAHARRFSVSATAARLADLYEDLVLRRDPVRGLAAETGGPRGC